MTTKKIQTVLLSSILLSVAFTASNIPQVSAEVDLFSGPGEIHGLKWNDENGNGVQDNGEPGIQDVAICLGNEFLGEFPQDEGLAETAQFGLQPAFANIGEGVEVCDFTDINGEYSFVGLELSTHTVFEVLPSGTINTTPIFQEINLTVDNQIVNDVNFGNKDANAPPTEVTIEGASQYEINGLPVVYWQSDITYKKDVSGASGGIDHCGADSPVAVKLVIGPFAETPSEPLVEMMMTNTSGEIWETTFGPMFPAHGTAPLKFYVDCPPDTPGFPEDISLISGEDEIQDGGNIYIDPSGAVTDACTDLPLDGTTVTLLVEDPFLPGSFIVAPASTPPMIPAVNPQTTLADGQYGWVVIPGDYKVLVEKTGFVSQTSDVLTIPPAVTDLNFALERVGSCPPKVMASLEPIDVEEDEGKFRVVFDATSDDPNLSVEADINGVPVENGQIVKLEIDDETEVKFKSKFSEKQCEKFQDKVDKKLSEGKKVPHGLEKKLEQCTESPLLKMEAPSFTLTVKAIDSDGNETTVTVSPQFQPEDEDEDD